MIKANINDVMRDIYRENGEKSKVLTMIRQRAYDLYQRGESEEDVIAGTLKYAQPSLESGKVTKADIENEIAKVFNINLTKNKAR